MSENSPYCGVEPCPVLLSSSCVFYQGQNLIYIGVNTNDPLQTVIEKINQAFQNSGVGYAFTNGIVQPTPFDPVQLGGSLIQNTTIGGNYTLTFVGELQAAKHITTGGTASQFVKGDGSLDSTSYQPVGNYLTALSGDGTASGPGSAVFTLTTVNFAPGTFGSGSNIPVVTVDAKGRVTNLTSTPLVVPPQSLTFTGDVVGSGLTGAAVTLSLQNVNSNVYNTNTALKFAVNAKGLVTSATPLTGSDINSIVGYTVGDLLSTASYANPSWITSLAWSKITGRPTTLSGYGITDALDTSATPQTKLGSLTASNFIKAGGTSTQFLKADGSVDSTAYAPINNPVFTGSVTLPGAPVNPLDAATKQYVDDVAQGLHIHASCVAATTTNLVATYSNGVSGVGATLTNNSVQAALVIDGVTLLTNNRVLVKNQSSQLQNGIYTVTNVGSGSTNWVLTRASDFNQSVEVNGGDFVFITGGLVNDNTGWVQTETGVTIGVSNISFTQFSGAGTYQAGNGLTLSGNIFSIDTAVTVDLNTAQVLTNKTITGSFTGNLSGNASTVTNGVYTTGSYSDPTWITGLAWSKILSTPTTLSGYGITDAYTQTQINNFFNGTTPISGYNNTNWDTAYNDKINSAAVTGTTTKTLTLTQQDGGTITASWTDINTDAVTSVFGRTGAVVAQSGDYNTSQVTELTNLYFTEARVLATPLTGFSVGANSTIASTDTILQAFNKTQGQINARVSGTGTSGQVSFWNGTSSQSGSNNLFWDNTNGRLGIGLNNPTVPFQVVGDMRFSGHSLLDSALPSRHTQTVGFKAYWTGANSSLMASTATGFEGWLLNANVVRQTAGWFSQETNRPAWAIGALYGSSADAFFIQRAPASANALSFSDFFRIFSTGNISIGSSTDAGFRLDVAGSTRIVPPANTTGLTLSGYSLTGSDATSAVNISGTWNTTGTPTLILANVTNTASNANSLLMDLQVGGTSVLRLQRTGILTFNGSGSTLSIYGQQNGTPNTSTASGFAFRSSLAGNVGGPDFEFLNGQVNSAITSGSGIAIRINRTFEPTSGTATYASLQISQIINQTGGANGITRGLYINPTLTSAADWRSIEWTNNTGWGLYGVGTADNYLNGSLIIGASQTFDLVGINRRLTGTLGVSINNNREIQSSVTTAIGYRSRLFTANATFTLSELSHFKAEVASLFGGASITNNYGFHVTSDLTTATNNYGFYGNIPSGTNRWNLYMNGTANNYLRGNLLLNTTTDAGFLLDVNGTARITPPADSTGLTVSGYSLTGSSAVPAIDISGTWNTTGTPTLIRANVTDTASNSNSLLMDLRVGGVSQFRVTKSNSTVVSSGIYIGSNVATTNGIAAVNPSDASLTIANNLNIGLRFSDFRSSSNDGYSFFFSSLQYSNLNYTSGTGGFVSILRGFAPTSGTGVFNSLILQNTINQTGGANGITRGLFVNPTLTSAADWRSIEWSNNTGWGLYGDGSANNFLRGSLGIGNTSLTGYSLRVQKAITGATIAFGITQAGTVQSDVTTFGVGYYNALSTQATSFTLASYNHFYCEQSTIGLGSTVTSQNGFRVDSSLIGATSNFGFRGLIPSGTGRWNLYMDGTADNYLAGKLGIGSTTLTDINFRVSNSLTGSNAPNSVLVDGTVTSSATSSAIYFNSISSTQAASFTLPILVHYRAGQSVFGLNSVVTNQYGFFVSSTLTGAINNFAFRGEIPSGTGRWNLYMNGTANNYLAGNLLLNTTTDAGFLLDVNGTARITGATTIDNTLSLRASSTASVATQIPVFTADPASTTRTLVTRTPAQLLSDAGGISGTIASGQVAFGTGTGTIGGDSGLTWDNVNKRLTLNGLSTNGATPFVANFLNGDFQVGNINAGFVGTKIKTNSTNGSSFFEPENDLGNSTLVATYSSAVTGSIFGQLRANWSAVLNDGTNGMLFGTINSAPIIFGTNNTTRWQITNTGILQSNGAQTIQTSTGNLTLATADGNGNILLTPNGTGFVQISANGLVTGTLEVDTVNNGVGDFLTRTAGGIITRRTAAEVRSDISAQPLSTNLTSLSGLTFASTSFVKMTAAGTFALDTNTYLTSAITSLNGLTASTQTFSNDTNVTITSTTSTHTIGWSGQLAVGRGGTGASTLTGVVIGNGASAMTAVTGTANQLLRRNAGNTAYEFFTPTYLTANQTITLSGDVTGSGSTAITTTLANSGVTAGTYRSVTVDVKGRVTAGTNPTTLSGYGITDAQPLDADLTAIAALSGTTGLLRKTAADTWSLDTNTYGLSSADITAVSLTSSTLTLTRATGNLTASIPTWNQNTTGSAATLTTTRTIWGQNFNGSANVTGALSDATTISMSGQLTNTVAIGTAPFVITSTTRVANLNVATAGTADTWTTARTVTIGNTGKSVNGSANVSWSLAEIGAQAALTNPVTGTGNTNYLAKFTSNGSTIGNSAIFESGGNVGIGLNDPTLNLELGSSGQTVFRIRSGNVTNGGGSVYIQQAGTTTSHAAFGDSASIVGGTPNQSVSIWTNSTPLLFYVNGSEQSRITTAGNWLLGTTTDNGAKLQVSGNVNITGDGTHIGIDSTGGVGRVGFVKQSGAQPFMAFAADPFTLKVSNGSTIAATNSFSTILTIATTGAATFSSSVTATNFITTSDRRLKSEIKEIKDAISTLSKFASYEYVKDGKQDAGFIAQEVREVLPYSVFENGEEMLTMSDRPILAYIHKAILELNERIAKLEN